MIVHSSIDDNFATGGGGLINGGTMTVRNSTINSNTADVAGGVWNRGTMAIRSTTISNNFIRFFEGAGIFNMGTLNITNSTVSHNQASQFAATGGGISNNSGVVELQNSIVALNIITSPFGTAPDCIGPITSLGNNIIGDITDCDIGLLPNDLVGDPGLGDFADDETPGGGHFPLVETSPAIDKGNNEVCSADPVLGTDQLGQPRIGACDIGAIEFQGLTIAIDVKPRVNPNKVNPNSPKTINVAIFSTDELDASTIDPATVRFGATGTEAAPVYVVLKDRIRDGHRDLILRFKIRDTGIKCGDTSASITGQISGGPSIVGSDLITTVQCKKKK